LKVVCGKGKKDRFGPYSPKVAELLSAWQRVRAEQVGTLFELKPDGPRALYS